MQEKQLTPFEQDLLELQQKHDYWITPIIEYRQDGMFPRVGFMPGDRKKAELAAELADKQGDAEGEVPVSKPASNKKAKK